MYRKTLTCPGVENVGMEERDVKPHFGRSGWEVVLEDDLTFVEPSLPGGPNHPGNSEPAKNPVIPLPTKPSIEYSLPKQEVQGPILVPHGSGNKAQGMIHPPE